MKIAIIKPGGLCAGGIEKYLQQIAVEFRKKDCHVDYFYTESVPCGSSGWIHPGTDPDRKTFMESNDIKLHQVSCTHIDDLESGGKWHNTNFFEVFDSSKYDVVIGATKGDPCWPFSAIKGPKIIETVHGTAFSSKASDYADAYILISDYQKEGWLRSGGDIRRTHVIYPMVKIDKTKSNRDRSFWGLPTNRFIYGMHQSARSGLFSSVPLDAYFSIQSDENFFVLLGGTDEYDNYAKFRGISNFMRIPAISDSSEINSFLSCLDVYAHGRMDGEVCSSAIIEAMSNGLPIITHPSTVNNGHLIQVDDCGFVASSTSDYAYLMTRLQCNQDIYKESAMKTIQKYESLFDFETCKNSLMNLAYELTKETRI